MKTTCIIQARSNSTRLPRKVLIKVLGKEILLHVIERVLNSKEIDDIIIATTVSKDDDTIVKLVKDYKNPKVKTFRGSEEDVLERYYGAAKSDGSDIIIRITSDCPLIDWEVIDDVVRFFKSGKYDYVSNVLTKRTYPRGLDTEVFTFKSLEFMHKNCKEKREREHVTTYIREHPEKFKTSNFENDVDLSDLRWTLDEHDDLVLIEKIYEKLYKNNKRFKTKDIMGLIYKDNSLKDINSHVEQKKNVLNKAN